MNGSFQNRDKQTDPVAHPIVRRLLIGLGIFFVGSFLITLILVIWTAMSGSLDDVESTGDTTSATGSISTARSIAETDDDPATGSDTPLITIVEFSDFECEYCREAFPIIRELASRHKDIVRYIYRDFPSQTLHQHAQLAAEAGGCAHEQGSFWAFHDRVFQNQGALDGEHLKQYARASGLNGQRFDTCLASGRYRNEVAQDIQDGVTLGARATPTWFVNGYKIEGVIPLDVFEEIVERIRVESE